MKEHFGRHLSDLFAFELGVPNNPVSAAEYEAKFLDNARRSIGAQRAGEAARLLDGLPKARDMAQLAAACG